MPEPDAQAKKSFHKDVTYHYFKHEEKQLLSNLGKEKLLHALQQMLLIRNFEIRAESAYLQGKIGGFFHSYIGQEAIQTAAVNACGKKNWWITSYRCHALALLLGATPDEIMAELYGRATGNALGRGGSMHLYTERMLGGFGIVAGQIPTATGAGFAIKYQEIKDEAAICFLGDGAVAQGAFHESLNMASLWNLPCIYVIENNRWGMGTSVEKAISVPRLAEDIASAYRMNAYTLDGMNYFNCFAAFEQIYKEVLDTGRPVLVEAITERFKGHSVSDPGLYRTKESLKKTLELDPLLLMKSTLINSNILTEEVYQTLDQAMKEKAIASMKYAEDSPWPDLITLEEDVLHPKQIEKVSMGTQLIDIREALRQAIDEEMERDSAVFVMGEEVGEYNGAYKVTKGLLDKWGPKRIIDTPIAELGFAGIAIGAAMCGLRPIVEFMSFNFSFVAADQLISNAPKIHYMSGNRFSVPIVFRGPNGAAAQVSSQHSHCVEAIYSNIPGLIIIAPSNAYDYKGLLKSAVRNNNPVLFLENELSYGDKMEIPLEEYILPIGKAHVLKQGKHVTLISHSRMVTVCLTVAEELAKQGIQVELIDLRTIKPLDIATIAKSVRKTGRCVLVEEGHYFGGISAEISFQVMEHCFDYLDAPIERVAQKETPMAYSKVLEAETIPNVRRILAAIHKVVNK